ncbi:MAG: 30S ribosomal protein S16 [Acidobacteriota bacterium]
MLKIRLRRMGQRHAPFYRVIVSDSREAPARGRPVATLGHYDPMKEPKQVRLDLDQVDTWISKGATPSPTVADLIRKERAKAAAAAEA